MMINEKIHRNNNSIYTDETIIYGLKVIFFNLLSILTIFFMGFIMRNVVFAVLFLISFIPMRLTMDGYHCKNIISCEIVFSTIYILIYVLNKYVLFLFILITMYCIKKILFDKLYFKKNEKIIISIYLVMLVIVRSKYFFNSVASAFCINILLREFKLLKMS